jgi:hypothetical protein
MRRILSLAFVSTAALTGCMIVPEQPVVEEPVVVVTPPPPPTCYEVAALTRVEVPAETRTVTSITSIDNSPYEPIETRTTQEIIVKQAEVFYTLTDPESGVAREVTNLCDPDAEIGPVGPAEGEIAG